MRGTDGTVILWQGESFLDWVASAPDAVAGGRWLPYVASLWESARELIPKGGDIVRHRAFGDWREATEVAERLQEMGVELVHLPGCSIAQANYFMALDALGLVSMDARPERLILVGCDASALPLARAVHGAGIPIAAVICELKESDFANWSFAVEPVVCLEHPSEGDSLLGVDAQVDDAELGVDDLAANDESPEEEEQVSEAAPAVVPPRRSWMKTIVTDQTPVHVELLPRPSRLMPLQARRIADLTNPQTLQKLRLALVPGTRWQEEHRPANHPDSVEMVRGWMARMPAERPTGPSDPAIGSALTTLEDIARNVGALSLLKRSTHHAVLSWLVQKFRAFQDAAEPLSEDHSARFSAIMAALLYHSKSQQPGAVLGMARAHRPQRESWHADAANWESKLRVEFDGTRLLSGAATVPLWNRDNATRELFELVRAEPHVDASAVLGQVRSMLANGVSPSDTRLVHALLELDYLLGGVEFAKVAAAVREERIAREREAAEEESAMDARRVSSDWPGFRFTRGKRAVIIGGDERPERRERLQDEFEFEEVAWVETSANSGVARVHDLAQRMKNGSVDLVIVLQAWVSHSVTDIVYGAEAGECRVVLSSTYGVNQVQRAVERYILGIRHT